MNFKNYLNEERKKSLTKTEVLKLIKKNCSDIVKYYKKSNTYIWRGTYGANTEFMKMNTMEGIRKSANTVNYYTLLMDDLLPSWKDYPKRSKSMICSNNDGIADGYGDIYVVFPYNGTKIAVCPEEDIWDSFMDTIELPLNRFNIKLKSLFEIIDPQGHKHFDENTESFKNALQLLYDCFNDKALKKSMEIFFGLFDKVDRENFLGELSYRTGFTEEMIDIFIPKPGDTKSNVLEKLNNYMSPIKNEFSLIKPGDSITFNGYSNEMWFSGECILVMKNSADSILNKL